MSEALRYAAMLQAQKDPDPILDIQVEAMIFPYVEPMQPCPWTSTPGWRMKGVLALRNLAYRSGEQERAESQAFGKGLLYGVLAVLSLILVWWVVR